MKKIEIVTIFLLLAFCGSVSAQNEMLTPDLSTVQNTQHWKHSKVKVSHRDGVVEMKAEGNEGMLILKDLDFSNGTIELDIKSEDEKGKSFLGLAFHGLNDSVYDAVYFRPFNFRSAEKSKNAMQYISHPAHTWHSLRENHKGKYENGVSPAPKPEDWFHVKIAVNSPKIEVFVNSSDRPSLVVDQLSKRRNGWIGFWGDVKSRGLFKNLIITPE